MNSEGIERLMHVSPVIPVLTIEDLSHARLIAEALVAGGLRVIEVTLRTPVALDAIREMQAVDGAIVGAGTVLNEADLDAAMKAGSQFVVSPGLTDTLARAAIAREVPFLPGIATASDIMRGLELGLANFKFFPAEGNGGKMALRMLAAPFPQCRFCPTGGISDVTASGWLALEMVTCVGGSWLVPRGTPNHVAIAGAARRAAALAR